jgi:hypothetical protein
MSSAKRVYWDDSIDSVYEATTNIWLMASLTMIFFMQSGFALLECGSVR